MTTSSAANDSSPSSGPRVVMSIFRCLASFGAWMVLIAMLVGLPLMGLSAALLAVFAPDLALVLAAVAALLCLPVVVRGWAKNRRSDFRRSGVEL